MAPPPFVPRDVFRLLVRLEAQKTHEVDTEALERRFRVPSGYAKDETLEQRERRAQNITPGPGAYEPPPVSCWAASPVDGHASAVFASRAPRDPFQLEPLARRAKAPPPHSTGDTHASPPPLGSFTRADRGISAPVLAPSPRSHLSTTSPAFTKRSSRGLSFERAPRATHVPVVPVTALGPAQYDVKRLWDPSETTGRATPDAPTPAVFSASGDRRELVWSPARALPSYAVADAWDASPHYAKHKRRVQQRREAKQSQPPDPAHVAATLERLAASASAPSLGMRRGAGKHDAALAMDPFEWLRRQPQGELRANALAARHGLTELVRPLTAAAADAKGSVELPHDETFLRPLQHDDDEPVGADRVPDDDDDDDRRGRARSSGDARITVSCRLPGGLVVSLRLYSARRVRHLKAALVRRQTRFQNEDQFELFLANGKPLAHAEESLAQAGLSDRALVQVVPR